MKVANHVRYVPLPAKLAALRPAHRAFMASLFAERRLFAGGPYSDGTGALFIYEVESLDEAETIFAADPFRTQGAIASFEMKIWQPVLVDPTLARPA